MEKYTVLFFCILILLLVIALCNIVSRYRYYRLRCEKDMQEKELIRLKLQKQEELLRNLIASRKELSQRNEELRRQLKEIQDRPEKVTDLGKVMEMLHPRLLTHDEEDQFRQSFSALHPMFLHRLRQECPSITKGEELFCMLLVLNQTNEEIAYTLGINRPSVIKTRYRLRRKIDCPSEKTIETWVRALAFDEKE
ncbi:DNA-binding CsgD family transcriptional regulator [Parabacteroides sp. PF5-6]|nr:DNA-binding CsgD family transcriptional regulator [Parabacteroides sp. PF5-6]